MRYMFLLYSGSDAGPAPDSPEAAAEMQHWFSYSESLFSSGAGLAGDPLHGTDTATTVRVRDGRRLVTDGPFAETKEVLGGYYIIEVPDLDTAIEWAEKIPLAPYGSVEIRPIMEMMAPPA